MPVDQTAVAVNLCKQLQSAAEQIMRGLEIAIAAKDTKESAGVNFTAEAVEAAIAADPSLKQADGNNFNSIISSAVALKAWLEAEFHDDNLQKVRTGGNY